MSCYITHTASYLPGPAISNDEIERYLGSMEGEGEVKDKVLAMNGIRTRHYAQDLRQEPTEDVYELATQAGLACLQDATVEPTFLGAGTTYAPLAAPGIGSIVHDRLSQAAGLSKPLEISSHAGVCSSAAMALITTIRAVLSGDHAAGICLAAEHASEVLKPGVMRPVDDRSQHGNIRNSQWFMSVFLRFMLSDGAGGVLVQNRPNPDRPSLKVNWSYSQSFANETSLCMKLDNRDRLLSQNLEVLNKFLFKCARKFVKNAFERHDDILDNHQVILPHMSSYFFKRKMEKVIAANCQHSDRSPPCWTNLATAGNTGAASIFVMLAEYMRTQRLQHGDRLLLFVPESGQFNFVLLSLTVELP